jgi:multiple sugar transport system permease protein/putative aldouronate transport system permease protein
MNSRKRKIRHSKADLIFFTLSGVFLTLLLALVLYPLVYTLSSSFSSRQAVMAGRVVLWPVEFSLEGYAAVFKNNMILRAYLNTFVYTATATMFSVSLVMITAYPLARRDLKGRGPIMVFFAFTMYFSGGLIPYYILIKDLGLIDTFWVMVIPGAMSVYNMIVARTFIQSNIAGELLEAASMDGCSDAWYFFKIVLPLSGAVIAVIALFTAVANWNAYFGAMIYLNTRGKMPLQIILREILVLSQIDTNMVRDPELASRMEDLAAVLKYALIVVATVPILCVYPFLQRYFVKGVMIGSLKG